MLTDANSIDYSQITVDANARTVGSSLFHVTAGDTHLQLEMLNDIPGRQNRLTFGTRANQLRSFRSTPQPDHANFIPRVGLSFQANSGVTFQWAGLRSSRTVPGIPCAARPARGRVLQRSHRPEPLLAPGRRRRRRPTNNAGTVYGPFDVPPGAIHCIVLHEWPRVRQIRYEIRYANELGQPFQPIPGAGFPRVATAGEESFAEALPADARSSRFYQVRVIPESARP